MTQQQGIVKGDTVQKMGGVGFIVGAILFGIGGLLMPHAANPTSGTTFDVVTSSLMMHHLSRDLRVKGLAEIYRVLKPGGRLLIADTMQPRGFFVKRLFAALSGHHGIQFSIEDLSETLKSAGLPRRPNLMSAFA